MEKQIIRNQSIIRNLAAALAITVAAVSVVVIILIAIFSLSAAEKDIQGDSDGAVNHLSEILVNPMWDLDEETVRVIGLAFFQDKSVAGIEIKGAGGRLFFSAARETNSNDVMKARPIAHKGENIGEVKVVYSMAFYRAQTFFMIESMIIIDIFIIFAVFLVLKLLIDNLVKKPIYSFSTMVSDFSAGNYTGAIKEAGYSEFKALSDTLGDMAAKIQSQFGELNASEEKFRAAFMTSPDALNISTLDGRSIDCNEGYTRMSGYTREETLGNTAARMNIWKDPKDREKLIAGLKATGSVNNLVAEFVKKDGSTFSGMMSAGLIKIGGKDHIIAITKDITDRKRLENILAESEQKFRLAFNTSPDAVNINRLSDGMFIDINEGFTRTMGFTKQDVEGKTSAEIKIWDNPEDRAKLVSGLREKGVVDNLEAVFRKKDGSAVTGLMSARLIMINNLAHILSITRDISERKTIENSLKQSEEKFRMAFMTSPDAIAISKVATGEYIETNDGMSLLTGYAREEIVGSTSKELKLWSDQAERDKMIGILNREGILKNLPVTIKNKSGALHYVLMSAMIIEINREKVLLTMARDITERRALEQSIAESEEKFRTFSEQSMVAVIIIQDDVVKYANMGMQTLSGYLVEEVLSWRPFEYMKIVAADYKPFVAGQAKKKQAGDKDAVNNYEIRLTASDGTQRWVNIFSRTVMYGGRPADMVSLVDISSIKEVQEKLINTVEELERSNDELEKFAYAASHDLQEPLRMVSNYVQLLKIKYKDKIDKDADFYIDTAVKGAVHMSQLITGLLDLSKMGKVEKSFKGVDMNEAAQEAKKILETAIKDSGAEVKVGDLPLITADRVQMIQLFQNLIGNGMKFCAKGVKPVIEISCKKAQDQWIFCVKDNGIGISPKYFDKIFVVFQTLYSKDEYEGSGIGLAICKKIVESHKGRIWVESEEGKGAAFYFTMPV